MLIFYIDDDNTVTASAKCIKDVENKSETPILGDETHASFVHIDLKNQNTFYCIKVPKQIED